MRKVLSGYIKTKEDFDRFCNLFLKKEVSPLVKVYDAPGRDGGIDADYTGVFIRKETALGSSSTNSLIQQRIKDVPAVNLFPK